MRNSIGKVRAWLMLNVQYFFFDLDVYDVM